MPLRYRYLSPLLAALLAGLLLAACGDKASPPPQAPASGAAQRPASTAATPTAASGPAGAASGAAAAALGSGLDTQALYNAACMGCHGEGVAGAPKLGDKAAWAPRIATGPNAMLQSVVQGKNAMPPKGTALNATETELRSVVDYMVQNSQ